MVCGAPIFSAAVRLAPPAGSTSVTFVSAPVASSHRDHARRQAAAAHRQHEAIGRAPELLHHLDRDRGLPLDHVRVVEGRQEMRAGLGAFRLGRRQRLVEEVAGQHDLDGIAAEGLGLQDLLLGRRHGHEDPPRHPEMRADEGHALRVVARTGADESRGLGSVARILRIALKAPRIL
jgi:hypothetical protein